MPPRIPNIPPPQLQCGTRTAKNHSVRMPPHPGFKLFVVFGKPFAQIPHLECLHTVNIIRCQNTPCFYPLEKGHSPFSCRKCGYSWEKQQIECLRKLQHLKINEYRHRRKGKGKGTPGSTAGHKRVTTVGKTADIECLPGNYRRYRSMNKYIEEKEG